MRGISWLAAKTGQLLKKDSAPWSEVSFLHLGMSILSNPRIGTTLLSIQNTNCVILEVMHGYGT
jgi:hypothetical protein